MASKTKDGICRICLSKQKSISTMKNIETNWNDNLKYLNLLEDLCEKQCMNSPNIPHHICKKCAKNLINSYLFKQKCIKAESKWVNVQKVEVVNTEQNQSSDLLELKFFQISKFDNCSSDNENDNFIETKKPLFETVTVNDNEESNDKSINDNNLTSDSDYFIDKMEEVKIPQIRRRRPPKYKKSLKYISCLKCNIRYNTRREYNQHFRSHHSRKRSLCQDCGKLIAAKYLEIHRTTHLEAENRKIFKCDMCDRTFQMYNSLREHKFIHIGVKKYECQICHEKFRYYKSRKIHMISRHSSIEEKNFKCEACNKTFRHSSSLYAHNNAHHKTVSHHCNVCSKIFTNTVSLSQHLKRHEDPALSCSECGKKFRKRISLETHKKHHTGERNYECEVCLRRYVDSVALRRHLKSVHPEYPLPPPRSKEFAEKMNINKNLKSVIVDNKDSVEN